MNETNTTILKKFPLFVIAAVFFLIGPTVFSQIERNTGNSLTSGTFQDFTSPYSVTGFPAIPVGTTPLIGGEDAPTEVKETKENKEDGQPDASTQEENLKEMAAKAFAELEQSDETTDTVATVEDTAASLTPQALDSTADTSVMEKIDSAVSLIPTKTDDPKWDKVFPKGYFGMSLIGLNAFFEVGPIDGITDKYEDIKKNLASDKTLKRSEINQKLKEIDNFLTELDRDGYIYIDVQANLLTPIVFSTNFGSGTWTIEMNYRIGLAVNFTKTGDVTVASDYPACLRAFLDETTTVSDACKTQIGTAIRAGTLSDDCDIKGSDEEIFKNCDVLKLQNDSYADLIGYSGTVLNLGYSAYLLNANFGNSPWLQGDVFTGFNYRLYNLKTSSALSRYNENKKDTEDSDILTRNEKNSTLNDVDVGALFVSENYQLGFGLSHLFSPSLAYKKKTVDLKLKPYITAAFYNLFDWGRVLSFNYYEDLSEEISLTGIENQWRVFSLGIQPDAWYIPSVRIGKRYNLVRSKLSYTQLGLTFFNVLNANVALSDETLEYKGDSYRRSFFVNLSIDINV